MEEHHPLSPVYASNKVGASSFNSMIEVMNWGSGSSFIDLRACRCCCSVP